MKHTAQEVRERAREDMEAHVNADMLLAYADMLEQMESAEPVAEVVATNCSCHPETCCCGDYTLILNDSTVTTGSKAQMRRIADAINTRPQAASADAEDAARWRYLLRNRFVLGNGTCLIDAHRTAQDAELLDAIDEARAEEAE